MRTTQRMMVTVLSTALALGSIARAESGPAPAAGQPRNPVPALAIPRLTTPPKIDGTFAPGEWAGAAEVTGMIDQFDKVRHARQATFWIGYDATNVYVAVRSTVPPSDGETSYLIGLAPGRVNRGDEPSYYTISVTPEGKVNQTEIFWKIGGVRVTWPHPTIDLHPVTAQTFNADPSTPLGAGPSTPLGAGPSTPLGAGKTEWTSEMAIPLAGMKVDAVTNGEFAEGSEKLPVTPNGHPGSCNKQWPQRTVTPRGNSGGLLVFPRALGGGDQPKKGVQFIQVGKAANVLKFGIQHKGRLGPYARNRSKQPRNAGGLSFSAMGSELADNGCHAPRFFTQGFKRDQQAVRARARFGAESFQPCKERSRPAPISGVFHYRDSVVLEKTLDAILQPSHMRTAAFSQPAQRPQLLRGRVRNMDGIELAVLETSCELTRVARVIFLTTFLIRSGHISSMHHAVGNAKIDKLTMRPETAEARFVDRAVTTPG